MPEPKEITSAREQFDLDADFSSSDLKGAYRCLAQIYHPDRFDAIDNWKVRKRAERELKSLNTNYKLLQDWLAGEGQKENGNTNRQASRSGPGKAQYHSQNTNGYPQPSPRAGNRQASKDQAENLDKLVGFILKLCFMFAAAMMLLGVALFWDSPDSQKLPRYEPPLPPSKDKLPPSRQKLPAGKPETGQNSAQSTELVLVPMRDWVEGDGYRFFAELVSIHLDGDSHYWGVFRRRTGEERYLRINELTDDDAELVRREAIAKGIYKPSPEGEAQE